jgi:hypothetical protein
VKVEEPVKEEEVHVKKRIAHEAAQKYPQRVVAPVKQLVNPMQVSCLTDYSENMEKNAEICTSSGISSLIISQLNHALEEITHHFY